MQKEFQHLKTQEYIYSKGIFDKNFDTISVSPAELRLTASAWLPSFLLRTYDY